MDFQIANKIIVTPMDVILHQIKRELTNGKLKDIEKQRGQNIRVTCPRHKMGYENHPSCDVFADRKDKFTQYGKVHCFSCGYIADLDQFVNECFEETGDFGKEWLLQHCDTAFVSEVSYLPEIVLNSSTAKKELMDESLLQKYAYYHNYMWERKLSREIVDLFEVGYDPKQNTLTFPVRDEKGQLLFITRRSVNSHFFVIPETVEKPVYLLYYILQNNIKSVAVCESQINALYCWTLGIPSIALFGTGSSNQYKLLKQSGIRVFNLYFDGDSAGHKGAERFKKAMPSDILVNTYILPEGKDVNDLSKEEVYSLKCV